MAIMAATKDDEYIEPGLAAVFTALEVRRSHGLPLDSKSALARLLDISKQSVSKWTRVPIERVIEIEKALGVPRHVQRPDIYQRVPASKNKGRARGRNR